MRGPVNEVLTELTKTGANYTWQDYAYREGAVLGTTYSNGTVRHFDVDHLGTVRLDGLPYTNVDIRQFYPYGNPTFP